MDAAPPAAAEPAPPLALVELEPGLVPLPGCVFLMPWPAHLAPLNERVAVALSSSELRAAGVLLRADATPGEDAAELRVTGRLAVNGAPLEEPAPPPHTPPSRLHAPPWLSGPAFDERALRSRLAATLAARQPGAVPPMPAMSSSCPSSPSSADDYAWWVASWLPLDLPTRRALLLPGCASSRLRALLRVVQGGHALRCARCRAPWGALDDGLALPQQPRGEGSVVDAHRNPGGDAHSVATLRRVLPAALGLFPTAPSTEATWFPGWAWTPAFCCCGAHAGWRYTPACAASRAAAQSLGLQPGPLPPAAAVLQLAAAGPQAAAGARAAAAALTQPSFWGLSRGAFVLGPPPQGTQTPALEDGDDGDG